MDTVEFTRKKLLALWDAYEGTQTELGVPSGTDQGTISNWIRKLKAGEIPKLEGLDALALGFGVHISELFPPKTAAAHSTEATQVAARVAALWDDLSDARKVALKGILDQHEQKAGSSSSKKPAQS